MIPKRKPDERCELVCAAFDALPAGLFDAPQTPDRGEDLMGRPTQAEQQERRTRRAAVASHDPIYQSEVAEERARPRSAAQIGFEMGRHSGRDDLARARAERDAALDRAERAEERLADLEGLYRACRAEVDDLRAALLHAVPLLRMTLGRSLGQVTEAGHAYGGGNLARIMGADAAADALLHIHAIRAAQRHVRSMVDYIDADLADDVDAIISGQVAL